MSKLTLDEAIKHCLEVAEQNDAQAEKIGRQFIGSAMDKRATDCQECATDHRQLAEWLTELKQWRRVYGICPSYEMCIPECKEGYNAQIAEYKRLLKAAVEDLNATVAKVYNGGIICECCKWKLQIGECCCPDSGGCDTDYRWRYIDKAKKLLNDEK